MCRFSVKIYIYLVALLPVFYMAAQVLSNHICDRLRCQAVGNQLEAFKISITGLWELQFNVRNAKAIQLGLG